MKSKWHAEPCIGKCGALTANQSGFCRYCAAPKGREQALTAHVRKYLQREDPIPFPLRSDAVLPCQRSELDFTADFTTDEHRTICGGCPAKEWCLLRALEHDDVGTCGGTSYEERQAMKEGAAT